MSDDFCAQDSEYVPSGIIDICRRSFLLVSNEGVMQELFSDNATQFMDIWEIVHVVLDIDSDIKIIYVDPVVSDSAGVV